MSSITEDRTLHNFILENYPDEALLETLEDSEKTSLASKPTYPITNCSYGYTERGSGRSMHLKGTCKSITRASWNLPGFLVYKEYLMKYPSVQSEIDQLRQTKQNWQAYDQGLEALFRTVQPFSSREKYANHARTIADLLIQCLVTHETLRQAHQETVNVAQEVNSGSDDPIAIDRYRKTMELQKRLEFPSSQDYHDILKTYGPLKVCGVLHVAYQIGETVSGSYMVCALFDSYILLATSSSDREKFRVMAIIHIRGSRLEEPANGIGAIPSNGWLTLCLHCSGTPYSWKLIFTFEHSLVELIFSACSEKEETEWLRNLIIQINPEQEARSETVGQPAVILNGRLLSVARRSSIHGTLITTGSPDYLPIHIKGTTALPTNQATRPPLGRSQSVQNSRRDIVLAPKRQKRVKMEKRLVDIWTRDVVPYPGMPLGIGESFMRTSTDVLMGKFTSLPQFARRTNSNRISIKNNSVEQFSIPKSENHKMEAEDEDSINNSPTKETGQGQGDDKTGLQKAATDAPSTQRRGFMSLRKKHSNLVQRAIGEAPSEVRYKGSRQSLRKRLSVALFKSSSPGKSRRSNSVEA
ncbi:RSP [Coccidioides immitis H538.4]|uniref:RSP n=1 Tax=Coccidioides immitis H538.4 TaxID=396776 RepID=A0A0J8S166_COCIT|nr:RSP [Coccidioides immitis H538.4]